MIDNTREYNLSLEMYYTVNTEICSLISPRLHAKDFSFVINSRARCRYYRRLNLIIVYATYHYNLITSSNITYQDDNIYSVQNLATIMNTDNR